LWFVDMNHRVKKPRGDPAGHDPVIMRKIRVQIDGDAMKADPAPQPDADRRDLVFARGAVGQRCLVGPRHPHADPVGVGQARHPERGQRGDDPFFQPADEGADVAAPAIEVEHHIGHALARPVIGVLPAAPGGEDRQTVGVVQIGRPGRYAGRVKRRVFQQPDAFARPTGRDVGHPRLHEGDVRSWRNW
jgi:hypothetical protein